MGVCAPTKDVGHRLPPEPQLYQGLQGDDNQSVKGNYETRLGGGG